MIEMICARLVIKRADLMVKGFFFFQPDEQEWDTAIQSVNSEGWWLPHFFPSWLQHSCPLDHGAVPPGDWVIETTSN